MKVIEDVRNHQSNVARWLQLYQSSQTRRNIDFGSTGAMLFMPRAILAHRYFSIRQEQIISG